MLQDQKGACVVDKPSHASTYVVCDGTRSKQGNLKANYHRNNDITFDIQFSHLDIVPIFFLKKVETSLMVSSVLRNVFIYVTN